MKTTFVGDDGLLRFGHARVLTARWAVIHYTRAASLPRRPVYNVYDYQKKAPQITLAVPSTYLLPN